MTHERENRELFLLEHEARIAIQRVETQIEKCPPRDRTSFALVRRWRRELIRLRELQLRIGAGNLVDRKELENKVDGIQVIRAMNQTRREFAELNLR